jgi:hypothetical protein
VGALFAFVAKTEGPEDSLRRVREAPDAVTALDEWARHDATDHGRILGVARRLEHVGRADPDATRWRREIAEHQYVDCRALAARLDREQCLAPGWTIDTAADMLWALISTEPLEKLLVDRHRSPEQYAERYARLLRSAFVATSSRCKA